MSYVRVGSAEETVCQTPCTLASVLWWMQIISLDLVLANGTLLTITPELQPHLWKAAQVPCAPAILQGCATKPDS